MNEASETSRQAWQQGVDLFEAGEYWQCHEALEPAWLAASGMEKRFLGGVILLAAALHKARTMGSGRGGRRNYAKAMTKLAPVVDNYRGIDVRELESRVHSALRFPQQQPKIPPAAPKAEPAQQEAPTSDER